MPEEFVPAQIRTTIANDIAQRRKQHQAAIARLKAAEAHARTFREEIPLKTPLVMLALGNSWFDYPLDGNSLTIGTTDIIAQLQTMGGNPPVILNISHYGDATTDELALPKQERRFRSCKS